MNCLQHEIKELKQIYTELSPQNKKYILAVANALKFSQEVSKEKPTNEQKN